MLFILKPRQAVQFFSKTFSATRLHFLLIGILALTYLTQGTLFIASIDTLPTFNPTGISKFSAFFWTYALIFTALYAIIQLCVLLIWKISQCLKGIASLKDTRLALTWSLICSAPMGFFLLLFQLTFNQPAMRFVNMIDTLALVGFLFFQIYGIITLLKGVSQLNQFSISKSLVTWLATLFVIGGGIYAIRALSQFF